MSSETDSSQKKAESEEQETRKGKLDMVGVVCSAVMRWSVFWKNGSITPQELEEQLQKEEAEQIEPKKRCVIIDARRHDEWACSHIKYLQHTYTHTHTNIH